MFWLKCTSWINNQLNIHLSFSILSDLADVDIFICGNCQLSVHLICVMKRFFYIIDGKGQHTDLKITFTLINGIQFEGNYICILCLHNANLKFCIWNYTLLTKNITRKVIRIEMHCLICLDKHKDTKILIDSYIFIYF